MLTEEQLWSLISEESHEINMGSSRLGQLAIKILRFGKIATDPTGTQSYDNVADVVREVNDLVAVVQLLQEEGVEIKGFLDPEALAAKKKKIRDWMVHSFNLGLLSLEDNKHDYTVRTVARPSVVTHDLHDFTIILTAEKNVVVMSGAKLLAAVNDFLENADPEKTVSGPYIDAGHIHGYHLLDDQRTVVFKVALVSQRTTALLEKLAIQ